MQKPERAICRDRNQQENEIVIEEDCGTKDFIGNGQKWAKVVAALVVLGTILFLALPSMENTPRLFTIVLKIWYALAIPMSIFGYISIAGHHPSFINLYCFYFVFNSILSIGLSTVAIVISIENHYKGKSLECDAKMCMGQHKYLIVACVNGVQVLFWLVSLFVMQRFYFRYRKEYLQWKNDYRQDCHQSQYHHWAFKHKVERSNSSASAKPLV